MSEDKDLEEIKQRMLRRILSEPSKPILLKLGTVNTLTDTNFDNSLQDVNRPLLVDFWAEWCAPCRIMAPIIEGLAREYSGRVDFAKLNTDENQITARRYNIMSIPNFIVFKQGNVVDQAIGAVGRSGIESMIRRHL